ncbi:MAG: hypothetical protein HQ565_10655 [Bacteroidetes bacterium]|nr:hypothetical protein [Bacteroidota bacterium]
MKKLTLITGIIIIMAFLAGTVNAQSTQSPDKSTKDQTTQTDQKTPGNFVDKNGDGLCDNHQNKGKLGKCIKFVDENGDGICDNCTGNGNCGQGNCCEKGMQNGKCSAKNKGNCCSKGMGQKHSQGQKNCQQATPAEPEKK